MVTARELVTRGGECARTTESLVDVARRMRMLDVGVLPICGENGRLLGMVTDHDIVVECVAAGDDPAERRAGELAQGRGVTIGADDSVEDALRTMMNADVRRLPVTDGSTLIGMVSLADLAMSLPDEISATWSPPSAVPPDN